MKLNAPETTSFEVTGRWWAAACAASLLSLSAHAVEPTLAKGSTKSAGEIQVQAADVAADVQRIPPEVRPQVLTQTNTMKQLVTNLYTRRALAQQAQNEGLAQNPDVAAALALARDKVLSDAMLVKIDKSNTPSAQQAEAMARAMYKVQAADFAQPEEVQARHILLAVKDEASDAAAKAQAQDLLKKIQSGANFADLAKQNSADPGSAANGGDLGFFSKGRMVPEFSNAAFALKKPGDVSDIVKTQFGYHIIQLVARKEPGQKSFDEVKEMLIAKVIQSKQQDGRVMLSKSLEETMTLDDAAIKTTLEKLSAPVAAKP